ncbi:MAG: crossover junction endodeoxyribonuclease RuvC [Oscillospiraceae bacterium]|nr:crossover junction endodeoxyribonuclease RuvC [Oscillospiraceae bacterium]
MIILGIDPGIATVGFGVIRAERGAFSSVAYGAVRTEAGLPLSQRLESIYEDIGRLIDTFDPGAAAIEELFFNTNLKTGIAVAHARGAVLLACRKKNVPMYEYTPLQVKQGVVGYGGADKHQVMEMVKRLLNLDKIPRPDDAADALAIALCHARAATSLMFENWSESTCSTI